MIGFGSHPTAGRLNSSVRPMGFLLRNLMALILVAFFAWLSVSSGAPTIFAPINFLVLGPTWLSVPLSPLSGVAGLLFVPVLCLIWCLPVFRGGEEVPKRSLVLLILAIAASAANLVFGIDYGLRWQGHSYVLGVSIISIALWVLLAALAWFARRKPTQVLNTTFHIALFCWLAWYALPTLGELL